MTLFCRCHACRCDRGNIVVTRGKVHAYQGEQNNNKFNDKNYNIGVDTKKINQTWFDNREVEGEHNGFGRATNIGNQNNAYPGITNIDTYEGKIFSKKINNDIYQTSFSNQEVEGEHCACDYCSCSHGFGLLGNKWEGILVMTYPIPCIFGIHCFACYPMACRQGQDFLHWWKLLPSLFNKSAFEQILL